MVDSSDDEPLPAPGRGRHTAASPPAKPSHPPVGQADQPESGAPQADAPIPAVQPVQPTAATGERQQDATVTEHALSGPKIAPSKRVEVASGSQMERLNLAAVEGAAPLDVIPVQVISGPPLLLPPPLLRECLRLL